MINIPHTGEMVLVDEIISLKDGKITTKTIIKKDNSFLEDGKFYTYKVIEIMAQSLGVYQGEIKKGEFNMGFLVGCRNFEIFEKNIKPLDEVVVCSQVSIQDENGFGVWHSEAFLNKKIIAKATLSVLSPSYEAFEELKNG